MLPYNFAKWQLVYYYYKKWSGLNCSDLLISKVSEKVRSAMGQNRHAGIDIMDSQSVSWGNDRALSSYDGNKKVKGITRYVVTDKNGFLLVVMVTVAMSMTAALLLVRVLNKLFFGIKIIIAYGDYR